jgi:magnesium-transporting ATPase (P-type)
MLSGYIAFLDPPKESAAEAIEVLKRHGVQVKVLTGDNEIVTRNVCRHVGLEAGRVVLGSDIEAMDDAALAAVAEEQRCLPSSRHSQRRQSSERFTEGATWSASSGTALTTGRR